MSLDDESPTQYFGPGAKPVIFEKFADGTEHSAGCSNARTGKCLCAYLAQWDSKPAFTPDTIKDFLAGSGLEPGPVHQPSGSAWQGDGHGVPHDLKSYSAEYVESLLKSQELWRERVQYWKKGHLIASILGLAGWAFAVARGIWRF